MSGGGTRRANEGAKEGQRREYRGGRGLRERGVAGGFIGTLAVGEKHKRLN